MPANNIRQEKIIQPTTSLLSPETSSNAVQPKISSNGTPVTLPPQLSSLNKSRTSTATFAASGNAESSNGILSAPQQNDPAKELKRLGTGASKDYYHSDGDSYGYLSFKKTSLIHQGGPENDRAAYDRLREIEGVDSILPKIDSDRPPPGNVGNGYWIEHLDIASEFKPDEVVLDKKSWQKNSVAIGEIKDKLKDLDQSEIRRSLNDLKTLTDKMGKISDVLEELSVILTKSGDIKLIDFGLASNRTNTIKNKNNGEYYKKTNDIINELYKFCQQEVNARPTSDGA